MAKAFDFDTNFLSVDSQEKGSEFQVLNDKGEPTGFFIRLAGPDSTRRKRTKARLQDFLLTSGIGVASAQKNRKQRRAAKSEGEYSGEKSDALTALQMDDMIAATISWRYPEGFDGPACTPDAAQDIFEKHPTLFEQVLDAADDLDRFTKS